VTHIFVASPIRSRLLQYAERIGASPDVRTRASELMAQPKGSLPHDDHFHVRIGCPAGMEKCIEQPLAHKHGHGHSALAHASPAPARAHAAAPHLAPPPSDRRDPPPEEPSAKREPKSDRSSQGDESVVPSLAPIVPGLDAAVIAAPLAGGHVHVVGEDPLPPGAQPIDDPDGVLDRP
jgi:penicillin-insensitive murein endopeptidase